jgi:1,4-dihydroxy-6-naphthoate synthase
MKLKLAISTCPNDTFAFHAILNRKIDLRGLEFEIQLLDIQQLNDGLLAGRFDVAKASFHAAIRLAETTIVLPSGSALGFGVGPLLLAARPDTNPDVSPSSSSSAGGRWRVLCPGEWTTATLLFRLFHSVGLDDQHSVIEHCVFSDIMPRLENGAVDFGVCIHEGRFTWQQSGLSLVEDLGQRWESATAVPLPLGGILASRSLDRSTIEKVQAVIRDSVEYGLSHRDETIPTMRKYAQEFADDVLLQHVDLYVNDWTVDLGDVGRGALHILSEQAKGCGVVPLGVRGLEIWK